MARSSKAGHRSKLESLRFGISRGASTHRSTFVDCVALSNNRCAGVEHALLEQLAFFFRTQALFSKTQTLRSTLCHHVNTLTNHRQLHVNAGTVPETENEGTQGRPMAG